MFQAGAAVREAFFGNAPEARKAANAALELSKSRDVEYGAAYALAASGDDAGSRSLAEDLEKRFPEDTYVRFTYLPILRSVLAPNDSDSASAIDQLQAAAPYDLAIPGSWFGFFGNLGLTQLGVGDFRRFLCLLGHLLGLAGGIRLPARQAVGTRRLGFIAVHLVSEPLKFVRAEEAHLLDRQPGLCDAEGGVGREPAIRDGQAEDPAHHAEGLPCRGS